MISLSQIWGVFIFCSLWCLLKDCKLVCFKDNEL